MLKYLDKTFFKFIFGFLLILTLSFLVFIIINIWGDNTGFGSNSATTGLF